MKEVIACHKVCVYIEPNASWYPVRSGILVPSLTFEKCVVVCLMVKIHTVYFD